MSTPTTSLTGAALLREAARVMRNRAYDAEYDKHLGCQTEWESFRQQCLHQTVEPFAPHVAAMTLTVALAMADLARLRSHGPGTGGWRVRRDDRAGVPGGGVSIASSVAAVIANLVTMAVSLYGIQSGASPWLVIAVAAISVAVIAGAALFDVRRNARATAYAPLDAAHEAMLAHINARLAEGSL